MINKQAVRENLDERLQNPTWKKHYDGAPSQKCREYIALDFYASETEDEEAFDALDAKLRELSREDVQYLYEQAYGPEKAKFAKLLEELK